MKNILVAIDFDDLPEMLLEHVVELAKPLGARAWVVHVAAPEPDFVGYEPGPQYIRELRANELRDEHKRIQGFAEKLKAGGIEAEALLIQGATSEMLLNEAVELKIDLIVIGYRRHGWLYNAFFGDIPTDIIRHTQVPVLVVPVIEEEED